MKKTATCEKAKDILNIWQTKTFFSSQPPPYTTGSFQSYQQSTEIMLHFAAFPLLFKSK